MFTMFDDTGHRHYIINEKGDLCCQRMFTVKRECSLLNSVLFHPRPTPLRVAVPNYLPAKRICPEKHEKIYVVYAT